MDKRLSNYVSRGIQGIATDPNLHKGVKKKKNNIFTVLPVHFYEDLYFGMDHKI
jgi:hypothetical protein